MVVGLGGLEPPTSRLSGVRSNHLSYRPHGRPRAPPGFVACNRRNAGRRRRRLQQTGLALALDRRLVTNKGRSLKTEQRAHGPPNRVGPDIRSGRMPGINHRPGRRRRNTPDSGDAAEYLPRKEVIQPHLPIRLPCYDFTPITSRSFGA